MADLNGRTALSRHAHRSNVEQSVLEGILCVLELLESVQRIREAVEGGFCLPEVLEVSKVIRYVRVESTLS